MNTARSLMLISCWLTATISLAQTPIPEFAEKEIERFEASGDPRYYTVLDMGYAKHKVTNRRHWTTDFRRKRVTKVQLVFSKYPHSRTEWITPYDTLLTRRLEELYKLDPRLKTDQRVKWELLLQTDCRTQEQAKAMFHGAVLHYKVGLTPGMKKELSGVSKVIRGKEPPNDSTVFKIFQRNPEWDSMVIVNDWTGSMYQYGAQVVLWHKLNLDHGKVTHMVFFNDGNNTPNDQKSVGQSGGIYIAKADSMPQVFQTMAAVMKHGNGGDDVENDVEAIVHALDKVPDAGTVVLIADNGSPVRDLDLLGQVKLPVKVVLCGMEEGKEVHGDYLRIARETNGSVHTIDKDITEMAKLREGERFTLLKVEYEVKNGEITPVK